MLNLMIMPMKNKLSSSKRRENSIFWSGRRYDHFVLVEDLFVEDNIDDI